MRLKTTTRSRYPSPGMSKMNTGRCPGSGCRPLFTFLLRPQIGPPFGRQFGIFYRDYTYPVILLLGVYPTEMNAYVHQKHRNVQTRIFRAALFLPKTESDPSIRHRSMNKCVEAYSYNATLRSNIKKPEMLHHKWT